MRLNADVFDQQYRDFQLNTFTGIVFVVELAPGRELQGRRTTARLAHTRCPGLSISRRRGLRGHIDHELRGLALSVRHESAWTDRLSFSPLWSGVVSAASESAAVVIAGRCGWECR